MIVIAVLAYTLITRRAPERAVVAPAVSAPAPAAVAPPVSTARELIAKAYPLFQDLESTREGFALAEDYCQRALKLDPTDAEVWAAYAQLNSAFGYRGWDTSPERREQNRVMAERAIRLDPNSAQAKIAQAGAWTAFGINRAETEKLLREVVAAEPANQTALRFLAVTVLNQGKLDDCLALNERSAALPGGDPLALFNNARYLWQRGRRAEAHALLQRSLAQKPFSSSLTLMTIMEIVWRGDITAAEATLKQIPQSALLEDRANYTAGLLRYYQRRPDEALEAWGAYPRDYYVDFAYDGPKGLLVGLAQEMAERDAAAKIEWRAALQAVEKRIAATPNKPAPYYYQAYLLACLGEKHAALEALRTCEQLNGIKYTTGTEMTFELMLIYARLGRFDEIFAQSPDRFIGRLRVDPRFDALRADPRFQALLVEATAPQKSEIPDPKPSDRPVIDQKSVAVLAFANLSDDKANEYFSDGISEELLNVLAKVPGLKVAARTSAFYFKGKEVPVPEIAKQLGVAYVVEGSVRKQGDKVRITAQLVKAADGFQLWGDSFTRELKDIFAVQDEIAGLIAGQLSLKLSPSSAANLAAVNPQAFELYLQGRQAWNLRSPEGYALAGQLLNRAAELSPGFSRTQVALADVAMMRDEDAGLLGAFGQRESSELAGIVAKIQAVLALEPALAEAHASLGNAFTLGWNFGEGERSFRQAIALNPNYASAHQWLAFPLFFTGRVDDALAEQRRAAELDPLSPRILDNLGHGLRRVGRYREAIAAFDRALSLQPLWPEALGGKALAYAALGRSAEAVALARQLPAENPATAGYQISVFGQAGLRAEAGAMLARWESTGNWSKVQLLLAVGRREEALAALDASQERLYPEHSDVLLDSSFDSIRDDPRFVRFIAALGWTEAHARAQAWRAAHSPEKRAAAK